MPPLIPPLPPLPPLLDPTPPPISSTIAENEDVPDTFNDPALILLVTLIAFALTVPVTLTSLLAFTLLPIAKVPLIDVKPVTNKLLVIPTLPFIFTAPKTSNGY